MKLFRDMFLQWKEFAGSHATSARRRAALGGVLAGIVFLGGGTAAAALPAQAAAASSTSAERFAAAATPFQNKALDSAMARISGGTRVSPGEVKWANGVILTISRNTPAVGSDACISDYFCVWDQHNYGSTAWQCAIEMPDAAIAGEAWFFNWAVYSNASCGSNGTLSLHNNTPYRAWKIQFLSNPQEGTVGIYTQSGAYLTTAAYVNPSGDSGDVYCSPRQCKQRCSDPNGKRWLDPADPK